jgi:aspartokinase-like uncharacterized kinase
MSADLIVVKVGGSLFDLPDLGPRLGCWLSTRPTPHVVIVPGGGPTADVIRRLDEQHHLGQERAHWLALQGLSLNAHFLAALLPGCCIIDDVVDVGTRYRGVLVLDAHSFARADESRAGSLPHHWNVTSDSIAARVARVAGARQLVLLKSTDPPKEGNWMEAGWRGFVDLHFAEAVGKGLDVQAINFRSWRP